MSEQTSSVTPPGGPINGPFDGYAGSYEAEVNRSIGFVGLKLDYFTRVKADYLDDLLRAHFGDPAGVDLLDVGCGIGASHALVAPRVRSLSGTDMSAPCLAEAGRRHPAVRYRVCHPGRLPYADAAFDAAVTTCVLHHVPPPERAGFAAELKRVVRPGGLVVVFEHNPINPLTRRAVSTCAFDADAVLAGQRELRALLAAAGLRGARSRAILSIPSFGPATRTLDRALGRLGLGAQYFATALA